MYLDDNNIDIFVDKFAGHLLWEIKKQQEKIWNGVVDKIVTVDSKGFRHLLYDANRGR